MKNTTRRTIPLILALAITLTLAFAIPLTASAATPGVLQNLTISLPGRNLDITFTQVGDKAADWGDYHIFFMPDAATLTLSRDVEIFEIDQETHTSNYAGKLEAGKKYTYSQFNETIRSFVDTSGGSYSIRNEAQFSIQLLSSYASEIERYEQNDYDYKIIDTASLAKAGTTSPATQTTSPSTSGGADIKSVDILIPGLENLYSFTISGKNVRFGEQNAYFDNDQVIVLGSSYGAIIPDYYYYSEGVANVKSAHSSVHYGAKNYIFVLPKDGFFGFNPVGFLGFVDSEDDFWEDASLEYIVFGKVGEVYKLRLEDNADMKPNGMISAVNIFFVFTSDMNTSYGEKRNLSELLVDQPDTTPTLDGASGWAKEELQAALAISGLVPDSVAKAGWTNATSRLVAAEAIVSVIEAATGKTMAQIATERGWNLNQNGFSDTNNQAVTFLKYAKVTTGVGNNKYDPNSNYTRAQIVTMIGRTAEAFFGATAQGKNPFTDVPDWAAPFVGYAADNKITDGVGGGLFDSDGVLQNQHTAVFCYRAFNVWK